MTTFVSGFSLGLSLILAIGSQNAFVLKQGLRRQHVFVICLVCGLSDAILISLGVMGFGVIVKQFPLIETFARYGGALFLTVYGLISIKSALTTDHSLAPEANNAKSLLKVIAMCLAFTWLNPHVYLDTVVLLGSISTQYKPDEMLFCIGAITASFMFFFALGYGAKYLAPVFEKPNAWKVLEFLIGVIMFSIAASLIWGI